MTANKGSRQSETKSRKDKYREHYDASKIGGESFFPETLVRDAIVALIIFAVILVLAVLFPATSQAPADPTSTGYIPRPEWYFLFFFQFLKLFPGSLEPLAAVVIPVLALIALIAAPFLDRNVERGWTSRKRALGIGAAVVVVLAALEVAGALSAPAASSTQENPAVQAGLLVYREFNCSYCHAINGVGGAVGPDLSTIGANLTKENLVAYLSNPNSMIPHTLHPKLQFLPDELDNLATYLLTLGAPVQYSAQAPVLFGTYCSSCHAINGKGGTIGPDLTTVGSRRSLSFLQSFITDPGAVVPGATMPAFKSTLTAAQIQDIAAYLYSLKSPAPSATATPTPTPTATPSQPSAAASTFGQLAQAGQPVYSSNCASCHGTHGEGVSAPALWGPNASLASAGTAKGLLDYLSVSMPPGAATLSHQAYLDVTGYLVVQGNDAPASASFTESGLDSVALK